MRDAFINELFRRAKDDPQIMLVVGDLGFGVIDEFASALPNQFLNAGIAEQSMMGLVAGLASTGLTVFVYSIANFPTFRCLEQIRNDVAFNSLNVTIVSVGAGLAYGNLGYTHHAVEDISIIRALPGVRVICPSDPIEAVASIESCLTHRGTKYVRLGKNGEAPLHRSSGPLDISNAQLLRPGDDGAIITSGSIAIECLRAAEDLQVEGISLQVWTIPTIKPFPTSWLHTLDSQLPLVTVEEHVPDGGFGSALLEAINDVGQTRLVKRVALSSPYLQSSGGTAFLRNQLGVSHVHIARAIREALIRNLEA